MEAASVGGGNIEVTQLGGMSVELLRQGAYADYSPPRHTRHDRTGRRIFGGTARKHCHDAGLPAERRCRDDMVLELDTPLSEEMLIQMWAMRDIQDATFLARREP